MKARLLLEDPDTLWYKGITYPYTNADFSFGFLLDYCLISSYNHTHFNMMDHLRYGGQATQNFLIYAKDDPDGTAIGADLQIEAGTGKDEGLSGREILAPAGRLFSIYRLGGQGDGNLKTKVVSMWTYFDAEGLHEKVRLLEAACQHHMGLTIRDALFEFMGTWTDSALNKIPRPEWEPMGDPNQPAPEPDDGRTHIPTSRKDSDEQTGWKGRGPSSWKKELSSKEKAAALAKAHIEPQNLTPAEKAAVDAFRGPAKGRLRSNPLSYQRIGDSLNPI